MHTEQTNDSAEFEIDGKRYSVMLLNTEATFKLQFELGNHAKSMISGGIDPSLMWGLAKRLLAHAEVDGFPIDLNNFARSPLLLDKVVMEALKANMPDFFEKISSVVDGFLTKALAQKLELASDLLKQPTSSSKQKNTGKRSSH